MSNNQDCIETCLNILVCQFDKLPFRYFGAWEGLYERSCSTWTLLKEKRIQNLVTENAIILS